MDQNQVSYALGLGIGQNLLGMGAKDINIDEFAHGVKDVLEGNKLEIDHKTAQIIVSQYIDDSCPPGSQQAVPGREQETC